MVQMFVDPEHVQSISYIIHCTYIHCIWHLFRLILCLWMHVDTWRLTCMYLKVYITEYITMLMLENMYRAYHIYCTFIHPLYLILILFDSLFVDACRHVKIDLYVLESVYYRVHYYANDGVHVKCTSYILHSYIHFIWFLFCLILCLLPSLVPAPVFL